MLGVDLLQVVLASRERLIVHDSTELTNKHAMLELEICSLVSHTVNTVGIELILSHSLLQ